MRAFHLRERRSWNAIWSQRRVCVDTPMAGKPIGSGCTASQMSNTECAGGICLPIEAVPDGGTTPGICTAFCTLGAQKGCGYRGTPIDAGPAEGACVLPFRDMGYNTGDLGLCLQLCDTNNDCYRGANWVCAPNSHCATTFLRCLVPSAG